VFDDHIPGTIDVAVVKAAHRLARLALDQRDPALARWAALQGRAVDPNEEDLYDDRFEAAFMAKDRAEFERTYADARNMLPPDSRVFDTYRRLRDAWGTQDGA
jgi:hypothetical protein